MAEEVLGVTEPANRGTCFDDEYQAATEDKNKPCRKMQQGYGTRSLIEMFKEKKRHSIVNTNTCTTSTSQVKIY